MELNNEVTCLLPLVYRVMPFPVAQITQFPVTQFRAAWTEKPARFVVTACGELLSVADDGVCFYPYTGDLHMYATVYYRSFTHQYLGTAPTIRHGGNRLEACVNGNWVPTYLREAGFVLRFENGNLLGYEAKK